MRDDYDDLSLKKKSASRGRNRQRKQRKLMLVAGVVVCLVVAVGGAFLLAKWMTRDATEEAASVDSEIEEVTEEETKDLGDVKLEVVEGSDEETEDDDESEAEASDPQTEVNSDKGQAVNVAEVVSASNVGENSSITYGIDVSRFQGTIDWAQVAGSGINYAMVRVGYRDSSTGEIKADSNAKYNMQEAEKNNIKIGAYFFSTAISTEEAIEEADWVAKYISQYAITYPVGYNCEGFENSSSRQYGLSKDDRSNIAIAFLKEILNKGYTPMFYASRNELNGDAKWNTSQIEKSYKIWMAWYNQDTANLENGPAYSGKCAMWQYTNQGTIPGISKKVDVDVAYFGYDGTETAKDTSERETATADVEALMKFKDANETVTAKSKTNLRDKPSQGSDSTVKMTLTNGQTATRTGISDSGWSRVVYEGVNYYAVSSYLTTDLTVAALVTDTQNEEATQETASAEQVTEAPAGFKTKFTDCNEVVTAKERVNLRSKPSVTDEDSQVVVTLYAGQNAVRTGVNTDYGWSRVEYNGQVLYCVSSYIKVVE